MYYYKYKNRILASLSNYNFMEPVTENEASSSINTLYYLGNLPLGTTRRSFCLSKPSLISITKEGPEIINSNLDNKMKLPAWLEKKIEDRKITYINTSYPNWEDSLEFSMPSKCRVNIVGLGDVGGILGVGLRLLGSDCISQIGIFDIDKNKSLRWKYELSQIFISSAKEVQPLVVDICEDNLFDCDMFIFCVSIGVPPLSETKKDVRMLQFEGNSRIINYYAKLARKNNFKGIFSIVSDPVDLLCKSAFISSNTSEDGKLDYKGMAPEQIRGYGLGVMHARAVYYSTENKIYENYVYEGRAYGPHGEGLIIANSLTNYNDSISLELTKCARSANIAVRKTGFKPYIAPALSSGSLSIIDTIKGKWHYSCNFIGGVYFGARNRLLPSGCEIESINLPDILYNKIVKEYDKLGELL